MAIQEERRRRLSAIIGLIMWRRVLTYIFEVKSKRFNFSAQVLTLTEDLDGLNFTAGDAGDFLLER